jgi:hypothetical protein
MNGKIWYFKFYEDVQETNMKESTGSLQNINKTYSRINHTLRCNATLLWHYMGAAGMPAAPSPKSKL